MHVDQAINEWGMETYRKEIGTWRNNHLAECPTASAQAVDARWECDCWSEYTRDDQFQIHFDISCDCGETTIYSTPDWDLPLVIEQLIVKMEQYRIDTCRFDDPAYYNEN